MGNFRERLLDKLIKQDINKSSCLARSIYIGITLLIVIAACIVAVVHTVNSVPESEKEMNRFVQLISREYDEFDTTIGEADIKSFKNKIINKVSLSEGELYSGEKFNLDGFLSENLAVNEDFSLTFTDLAVLLNYNWNENIVSAIDYSVKCVNSEVSWSVVLCVNFSKLSEDEKANSKAPSMLYVTFNATVNVDKDWDTTAVVKYSAQVNRLTGEDNEFAVKKVCELLKLNEQKLKEDAIYPFTFCNTQSSVWKTDLAFLKNNCTFKFTKKE